MEGAEEAQEAFWVPNEVLLGIFRELPRLVLVKMKQVCKCALYFHFLNQLRLWLKVSHSPELAWRRVCGWSVVDVYFRQSPSAYWHSSETFTRILPV